MEGYLYFLRLLWLPEGFYFYFRLPPRIYVCSDSGASFSASSISIARRKPGKWWSIAFHSVPRYRGFGVPLSQTEANEALQERKPLTVSGYKHTHTQNWFCISFRRNLRFLPFRNSCSKRSGKKMWQFRAVLLFTSQNLERDYLVFCIFILVFFSLLIRFVFYLVVFHGCCTVIVAIQACFFSSLQPLKPCRSAVKYRHRQPGISRQANRATGVAQKMGTHLPDHPAAGALANDAIEWHN